MSQNILIIGSDVQWEERELLKAVKKAGFSGRIFKVSHLDIHLGKVGAELFYEEENITPLFRGSRIIFRRTRGAQEKMITLSLLAKNWHVPFTDSVGSIMSNLNKALFMPSIRLRRIRHIPTCFAGRGETCNLPLSRLSFPLLAKPVHGRHGEGIQIIKNEAVLRQCIQKTNKALMVQPFLFIESEYRVFVLGGKSPGVIQKIPQKGSTIANYAAGARFIPAKLNAGLIREAIGICQKQGIDIGGVDLAKAGKDFYLLEVNRCPEFRAFSKATGINTAEAIVRLAMNK